MADNRQLPPYGGPAGYSAVSVQPGPQLRRAVLVAVLLVAAGAVLGLLGGLIWAAAAPRVVYKVATLSPPTAYAINAETTAFIAADAAYIVVALAGGALLGLGGYLLGVRKYGPVPMVGVVAGAVAAAFLVKWLGPQLTGEPTFNAALAGSKVDQLLRAPIALGAQGALVFWPVAAALAAGVFELVSIMRVRRLAGGWAFPPPAGSALPPPPAGSAFPPPTAPSWPQPPPDAGPAGYGERGPGSQPAESPGSHRPLGGYRHPEPGQRWPSGPSRAPSDRYEPSDSDQYDSDWPTN